VAAHEHRLGLDDRLLSGDGGYASQGSDWVGHVVEDAEVEHYIPRPDRDKVAIGEVQRYRPHPALERLLSGVEPPAGGRRIGVPRFALVRCRRCLACVDVLVVDLAIVFGVGRPEVVVEHRDAVRAGLLGEEGVGAVADNRLAREVPTFGEYAEWWLQAKIDGVLGEKPISENTIRDYRWRLNVHLLPFFGRYRLDEIDRALCLEFKTRKLREADEQRKAILAGADLRDQRGRGIVPLGPASMRKLTSGLASILDDAIEDEHIDHHPARGKRMRVHVPKPNRTFLEMDELACVLDAAAKQDRTLDPAVTPHKIGPTRRSSRTCSRKASGRRRSRRRSGSPSRP
jgi:hypothetical protein